MKKITLTIAVLVILSALPQAAFAARMFVDAPTSISIHKEALVEIKIDTEKDTINAVSGELSLPAGLTISKILDGTSAITLWVERPSLANPSKISFSGLTPGGISGTRNLFTLVVEADKSGTFPFTITNATALKNDGKGTAATVAAPAFKLKATTNASSTEVAIEDTIEPEKFTPVISRTPDLFNNDYFVSFLTQDKGTGVDHYEFASTFFGSPDKDDWKKAESPLVLAKSDLYKKIFIKAVDKLGNEREVSVSGPYVNAILWVIIIVFVLLICALFISKRRSR